MPEAECPKPAPTPAPTPAPKLDVFQQLQNEISAVNISAYLKYILSLIQFQFITS
jgi:hypothetical protein